MSVKALIRVVKASIRNEEWTSVEITSSCDENRVRVHRATPSVPARKPSSKIPPPAKTEATEPRIISGRERKKLKFQRHGALTRLLNTRLGLCAWRGWFASWKEHTAAQRAVAKADDAPVDGATDKADMTDTDDAGASDGAQPAAVGATPAAPSSPTRPDKAAAKRQHASPGVGQKRGRGRGRGRGTRGRG